MLALGGSETGAGIPIVFLAGLASFLSPCVLPLLPGYLAYMSGQSIELIRAGEAAASKTLVPTTLFVLGFSTVFVALGTTASILGSVLIRNQQILTRISGGLIIVMGLAFLGLIPLPWLYSDKRLDLRTGTTLPRNYLMGLAFGFGWSPCIGPTLAATFALAANAETAGRGALLLGIYSLGLGVPFLLAALGISKLSSALDWIKPRQRTLTRVAGVLLVVFGVMLIFGQVYRLSVLMQNAMRAVGLEKLVGL